MKKKGFTLVELLAVIAILAILVIMALPAVLRMFNQARVDSFTNELNTIIRTTRQQYLLSGGEAQSWSNAEGSTNKLDLTGDSKLKYYVEINGQGQIIKLQATNGNFQYNKAGVIDTVDSSDVEEVNEDNQLVISANGMNIVDESYFAYEIYYNNVTYNIDLDVCKNKYISQGATEQQAANICTCNNETGTTIKGVLQQNEILPSEYSDYGLSNVVLQNGEISIIGYKKYASVAYDIDLNTCINYDMSRGYTEQEAISFCNKDSGNLYTIEDYMLYGLIQSSEYSNYGLSNVSAIETSTDVIIPSTIQGMPVTAIIYESFNNRQLTSILIPNSVIKITENAFANNQLTSVVIPSSVKYIGNSAFANNQLSSVTIEEKYSPNNFTSYGSNIWGWASGYSDSDIIWLGNGNDYNE